ncbi:hypothetical protein [Rhodococcoides navarretei]|uniref:hypothetical protein n=1 Tax=Rhodococcus navarretei TaxID=3128981 RepID=UPI003BF9756E
MATLFVIGVGMTKFEKPGSKPGWDYPDMARESSTAALVDAGITYTDLEQAQVGYVYGHSTSGQRVARDRQGRVARIALQHNIGLGGTAVVTAFRTVS